MTIDLYYNQSENNQLDKDLTFVQTLEGTLRDVSNVVNPEIMIHVNRVNESNYVYIPAFSRYYFINEVTSVRTGLWVIKLTVDVLMSYKQDIRRLTVVLKETEATGIDKYLPDERVWIARVKDKTDIIQFPNGLLENGEYILITAGG